jgi:putrescine aminotransferase
MASLWYCAAGHGRAPIIDAVTRQLGTLDAFHVFDRFTHDPADRLAERVAAMAPVDGARVMFTSGGSEAVDTAIKLVRLAHFVAGHKERTLIVSRAPSYHGVTYGGLTATGLPPNQQGFGPLLPDVVQVPKDDLAALDDLLAREGQRVAAIFTEPVIGAGGVYPPVPGYLRALRERCDRVGAFLVMDEVITGFGRLGTWFGASRYEVRPDIIAFAKAITSGYVPLGGVVVGAAVHRPLEADPTLVLRHGVTYSGHPTACAAGLANLDLLEREGLLARGQAAGKRLAEGLRSLVDGARVAEVRGDGAVWALGFAPGTDAVAVRERLLDHGVIARPIGPGTMAFCPPFVIEDDDVDRIVDGVRASL